MTSDNKWTCKQCTYLNYPSANRCTLCRNLLSNSPNIFEIAQQTDNKEQTTSSTNNSSEQQQYTIFQQSKWTCNKCTYANFARSLKCVQCQTMRLLNNKSIIECDDDQVIQQQHQEAESSQSSKSPPPSTSTSSLDTIAIAKKLQKWTCSACTYENWPKTTFCVMCYTSKDSISSEVVRKRVNHDALSSSGKNKSPKSSNTSSCENIQSQAAIASAAHGADSDSSEDKLRDIDWLWLQACKAVTSQQTDPIEAYIAAGGDVNRLLGSSELKYLRQYGAFEHGQTLMLMAVTFRRDDLFAMLMTAKEENKRIRHRVPCYVAQDVASAIRRQIAVSLRQRKGELPCYYFSDLSTFSLPVRMFELPFSVQTRLFDELLDRNVQKELEVDNTIINWMNIDDKLFPLWNRTAGDCLLDSVLQATWGVFDSENSLRQALADSLNDAANIFQPKWRESESLTAQQLNFSLDDDQWDRDWDGVLQSAREPHTALEKMHVFALAHVIRRPIIIYGITVVKSVRGEDIGYADFQGIFCLFPFLALFNRVVIPSLLFEAKHKMQNPGNVEFFGVPREEFLGFPPNVTTLYSEDTSPMLKIRGIMPAFGSPQNEVPLTNLNLGVYLPLLWEPSFCWRSPICLGYTNNHFTALVPAEPTTGPHSSTTNYGGGNSGSSHVFVPLVDSDGSFLRIHFLSQFTQRDPSFVLSVLRTWFDVSLCDKVPVCKMKLHRNSPLVQQMIDDWLEVYRRKAQQLAIMRQQRRNKRVEKNDENNKSAM